jgi:hypothetical protein
MKLVTRVERVPIQKSHLDITRTIARGTSRSMSSVARNAGIGLSIELRRHCFLYKQVGYLGKYALI